MPNNILITPGSASIQFSGSGANTIRMQVEQSGSVAFYGNSGSLFSIVDQMSGSLMSVNDMSGLPILEVFSDDRIVMGSFNRNTLVVTGSRIGIDKAVPTADLDISGSVLITGSLGVTGAITGSISSASFAQTASFALNAGAGSGFPYSGSAIITGSLLLSSSTSPVLRTIGNILTTGSVIMSSSAAAALVVIGNAEISGSLTVSGSSTFTNIGPAVFSGSLTVSGSSTFTNIGPAVFSGSLNVTQGITGSFAGTSSNAVSSSFATTASQAINSNAALYSVTASWAANIASEIQRSIKTVEYFDTLTTFNGVRRWWANTGFTIDKVHAFLIDAPQGQDVIIRVNKNGTQASLLTIAQNTQYATSTPFIVLNTPTTASQDYITVDITQVGTTQAGGYLTIVFEYQ